MNKHMLDSARGEAGSLWVDEKGYDVLQVPPGASLEHDGQRIRVYTTKEQRWLKLKGQEALPKPKHEFAR